MLFLLFLFIIFEKNVAFLISPKIYSNKIKNIKTIMYYEISKDYDNPIVIMPRRQTLIIVNNWVNATLIYQKSRIQLLDNKYEIIHYFK